MDNNGSYEDKYVEELLKDDEPKSIAGKILLTIFLTMLVSVGACAAAYYFLVYKKEPEPVVETKEEEIIVVEEVEPTMPELRGFDLVEAKEILNNLGIDFFDEDEVKEFSDIAEGLVIECNPAAGKKVSKDTKVILTVSKGKENEEPEAEPEPTVNKTEDVLIKVNDSNSLRIRDYPSTTTGNQVGKVCKGTVLTAHETYSNEGYTWYRIADNEWIADDGTWIKKLSSRPSDGSYTIKTMETLKRRSSPEIADDNVTGKISKNTIMTAYETKTTTDGYMWYRIESDQWIADDGSWVSVVK